MDSKTTDTERWSWLTGTSWYCVAACVPALRSGRGGALSWVADQTVWRFTGVASGYLWGVACALVTDAGETPDPSQKRDMTFVGSISPSGQVHITFIQSALSTTVGTGQMSTWRGETAFEMQMSSGPGVALVAHWAYMCQVKPGMPAWEGLPGAGMSVEAMVGDIAAPEGPGAMG